jgi:hypothetical protein
MVMAIDCLDIVMYIDDYMNNGEGWTRFLNSSSLGTITTALR